MISEDFRKFRFFSHDNNTQSEKIWPHILRLGGYIILILLVSKIMMIDAASEVGIEGKFSESSYTEITQNIILGICSLIYLGLFFIKGVPDQLSLLLFGFSCCSFIREQDALLDYEFFDGAWQIGVYTTLAIVLMKVFKNLRALIKDMQLFLPTYIGGIFMVGVFTTYLFSRLYGRGVFWKAVMEDRYFRSVKNASEECIELYGYTLLLIAAIEFAYRFSPVFKRSKIKSKRIVTSVNRLRYQE